VIERNTQQIIDDVEAFLPLRKIDAAQINKLLAEKTRIVSQHKHHVQQLLAGRMNDQLAAFETGTRDASHTRAEGHPNRGGRGLSCRNNDCRSRINHAE
jgi:hypothetical protein